MFALRLTCLVGIVLFTLISGCSNGSGGSSANVSTQNESNEEDTGVNCADGLLKGDETDVDCGGSCPACALGKSCKVAGDCASGLCQGGVCNPVPTCTDGIQNQDETGVDCGGVCPDCPCSVYGQVCDSDGDCCNGVPCIKGRCQYP